MTGESFFSLGSAAAGSCLGHDAIHRTEHSLERVARGLERVEMERDKGGRGRVLGDNVFPGVSVLWRTCKGSSISGTETPDSRVTMARRTAVVVEGETGLKAAIESRKRPKVAGARKQSNC